MGVCRNPRAWRCRNSCRTDRRTSCVLRSNEKPTCLKRGGESTEQTQQRYLTSVVAALRWRARRVVRSIVAVRCNPVFNGAIRSLRWAALRRICSQKCHLVATMVAGLYGVGYAPRLVCDDAAMSLSLGSCCAAAPRSPIMLRTIPARVRNPARLRYGPAGSNILAHLIITHGRPISRRRR